MPLSTTIKSIQDIMRKDVGVDGDALLDFVGSEFFLKLKELPVGSGDTRAQVVRFTKKEGTAGVRSVQRPCVPLPTRISDIGEQRALWISWSGPFGTIGSPSARQALSSRDSIPGRGSSRDSGPMENAWRT